MPETTTTETTTTEDPWYVESDESDTGFELWLEAAEESRES